MAQINIDEQSTEPATPAAGTATIYVDPTHALFLKDSTGAKSQLTKGTAAPVNIGTANSAGISALLAAADHVHAHAAQTDPTLHAIATASSNGFMSSSDKTKVNQYPSVAALGDIVYGSSTSAFSILSGNTAATIKKLVQTGNGTTSAPPQWVLDGWELLAIADNPGGLSISTGTFTARRTLKVIAVVNGYAPPGDTVALQFNNDTAAGNYRYRFLSCAAGATTFTAPRAAVSTDRITLAPADSTNPRVIEVHIHNTTSKTEKILKIDSATGTASAATQAGLDLGNGAWFSSVASTQITSITMFTSTQNWSGGIIVLGRDTV